MEPQKFHPLTQTIGGNLFLLRCASVTHPVMCFRRVVRDYFCILPPQLNDPKTNRNQHRFSVAIIFNQTWIAQCFVHVKRFSVIAGNDNWWNEREAPSRTVWTVPSVTKPTENWSVNGIDGGKCLMRLWPEGKHIPGRWWRCTSNR